MMELQKLDQPPRIINHGVRNDEHGNAFQQGPLMEIKLHPEKRRLASISQTKKTLHASRGEGSS